MLDGAVMPSESRLEELFLEWQAVRAQGQTLPAEEVCGDSPELVVQLEDRIREAEELEQATVLEGRVAVKTNIDDLANDSSAILSLLQEFDQVRFLAKGGLGEVFVAQDRKLRREVVLKLIRGRHAQSESSREQFEIEAEVTAQLDHPGVVPVYGLGETSDSRLFYAMRFIQGDTLEEKVSQLHACRVEKGKSRHNVELRRLLDHFVSVCKTIAYAHNRGILHRDIKPKT